MTAGERLRGPITVFGLPLLIGVSVVAFFIFLEVGIPWQINEVTIEVAYDGYWQGAVLQRGSLESWSGHGVETMVIKRPSSGSYIVSFNAQKLDGSTGRLTLRIRNTKGEVLKEVFTESPYGLAQIAVEIQ